MFSMVIAVFFASAQGSASEFNVSNTLGDRMVLQRSPQQAVVYGMGTPGTTVATAFAGTALTTHVGPDGLWRQKLPATAASKIPQTIAFKSSTGGTASLKDVLFGDVYVCGGEGTALFRGIPHAPPAWQW